MHRHQIINQQWFNRGLSCWSLFLIIKSILIYLHFQLLQLCTVTCGTFSSLVSLNSWFSKSETKNVHFGHNCSKLSHYLKWAKENKHYCNASFHVQKMIINVPKDEWAPLTASVIVEKADRVEEKKKSWDKFVPILRTRGVERQYIWMYGHRGAHGTGN